MHDKNIAKLIEFFENGEKSTHSLGFELEHILLHEKDRTPVSYSEEGGVKDVLEWMAFDYDEKIYEKDNLVGLSRKGEAISIEPAAQLEISAGPFKTVQDVEVTYLNFRRRLDPILEHFGLITPMVGYNPAAKAKDLELIPKERYKDMTKFLGAQSYYAICMMRGTASLQISVDYANEKDAVRKMQIAQKLAPILALMTDNSPIFEGKQREKEMVRTIVWSGMYQDRVGTVPGSLDKDFSYEKYAEYILSREAVLIPDGNGDFKYVGKKTFDELYANKVMDATEVEHALSMVWPDARLKNFVEIRHADALPFEFSMAYTALIKNLFYDEKNLDVLETLLDGITEDDVHAAKKSLIENGYAGAAYGRGAKFWADMLMLLASSVSDRDEVAYLEPLQSMVDNEFTLASTWQGEHSFTESKEQIHSVAVKTGAPLIGIMPRYDYDIGDFSITAGYMTGVLDAGGLPFVLPLTDNEYMFDKILESCDGFLVPGGHDINPDSYGGERELRLTRSVRERDQMELAMIPRIIAADKPLLGVCRGMQMINVASGGTLYQDIRSANPESTINHAQPHPFTKTTHTVDVNPNSRFATIVKARHLDVNSMHHQCVRDTGEGLVVAAKAPDGTIEAIEMPEKTFVLGVQWHPEYLFKTHPEARRIFHEFVRAASRKRAEDGTAEVNEEDKTGAAAPMDEKIGCASLDVDIDAGTASGIAES